MSDSVTITQAQGAAYTWSSANFTWGSATAGKSWNSANPTVHGLTVAVALALSDARAAVVNQSASEQLGLAGVPTRQLTIRRSETLAFAETYADLIAFVLRLLESFGFSEVVARGAHKAASESLQLSDRLVRGAGKGVMEDLALSDATARAIRQRLAEDLALADALRQGLGKQLADGFGLGDGLERAMVQRITEIIGLAETYTDLIAWMLAISENLGFSDGLGKHTTQPLAESFQLSDRVNWQTLKHVTQALALAEAFGRTVAYRRSVNEGLGFSDSLTQAFCLNVREALALAEQYRRHANGVVSDMLVASTEITEQDFINIMEAGHPPGFTDFRDFIQGDHTYRRALFRAVLESQNADRGFIDGLRVTVDVPDVFDRGTEQISDAAAGVTVSFSRTFLVTPEVTITHKGGTVVAVPRLVGAITTSGFTAVLEDNSGARVAGSFTWIAQGY